MAGANKNYYRKKAMKEFGRKHKKFRQAELMVFMNTYKTAEGRRHRMTQTDKHQLTSLLYKTPEYIYLPTVKQWEYIGD